MNNTDLREELNRILTSDNVAREIKTHEKFVFNAIPEAGHMQGFEHNHPHHHLDVWNHTLAVISNLNTHDLELNMSGLLHDIGKPFSFQDEEVRHFHGHPEASYLMSSEILRRLGYDSDFMRHVGYLVARHDTPIDVEHLDNSELMIKKLIILQYADARAHHPDKVQKRIDCLDDINRRLTDKFRKMKDDLDK